jgi:hypothetical protein
MLIRASQFHGARPRRDPRLLGEFECQEAVNCRLWSGKLGSWRKPAAVLDVGTNYLLHSNEFAAAQWLTSGLGSVVSDIGSGPDGSTSADKLRENVAASKHTVRQTVAKAGISQDWTGAVSIGPAERTFAYVAVGDGGGLNVGHAIINLATGAVPFSQTLGNFSNLRISTVAEASGFRRIHLIVKSNATTTIQLEVGGALDGTTFLYTGTSLSGVLLYGASLRPSSRAGAYRETLDIALPSIESIYLYKGLYWFTTATRANFVKGPIAGDSTDAVYFTGGPAPHLSVTYDPIAYAGGSGRGDMPRAMFTAGLPAPPTAPNVVIQPQTGSVTNVTNVVATLANQTTATFSLTGVNTDGYDVVPSCRFNTTITTSTATSISAIFRIMRSGKVIAEIERSISLSYSSGVTVAEVVDVTLSNRDSLPAGVHAYDFSVTVTASSGSVALTHNHTEIAVRYAKARIVVGGGHPFVVSSFITVAGVVGFEDVNAENMQIVAVDGTSVSVDNVSNNVYVSGGTWKKDYLPEEREDTGWVVTFLTQVGNHVQEGPPCAITDPLLAIGSGEPVLLTNIPTGPPGDGGVYNITGKRLYRSNVANNGDANFQFVAELALGDTSYTDTKKFSALGEILPSETWVRPPTDMTELTAMHNGVMAGISKNQVCFSEPFQPHAWPTEYRVSINFTPVALAAYSDSLLVCTQGKPAIVIGFEPGSLRPIPSEISQPCASVRGVVDMGDYVTYPGDDGLVMVSSAQAGVITQAIFTKEEWQRLNPASFIAGEYDGRYVCFFIALNGTAGGFVLDPKEPTATFTTLDFHATVAWTDPKTGDLYLVIDEQIMKWDSNDAERFIKRYRSRRYPFATPWCPARARVVADAYPIDFRLFANPDPEHPNDVVEVHSVTVENGHPFVLPDGYVATQLEYEVKGLPLVTEVSIASSVKEIMREGSR